MPGMLLTPPTRVHAPFDVIERVPVEEMNGGAGDSVTPVTWLVP